MLCSACRNKTSTERCPSKALKNLLFCGKHAKSKNVRLWAEVNSVGDHATLIQKVWRGYRIRSLIRLAGPGVLCRKDCHNEEDFFTCEEREKVHPMNYFGLTESGKLYWFDIRSIFQWSVENLKPTNPYTKQDLSLDDRKRMKECVYRRELTPLPLFHDVSYTLNRDKLYAMRWIMISQFLEEQLFEEFNPMNFAVLNRTQVWTFTQLLRDQMLIYARRHKSVHSRRNMYYVWLANCFRRQTFDIATAHSVLMYLGGTILRILKDCKDPHEICFEILSARHRL